LFINGQIIQKVADFYKINGKRSFLFLLKFCKDVYWFLVPGCWLLVAGSWFLVPGCWLLVAGSWLLVAG